MSSFPAMISTEPPPIDSEEDEEDFEEDEFRSNGLRLDVSADQTPMSSPRKPPLLDSNSNNHNHKVSPLALSTPSESAVEADLVNGRGSPSLEEAPSSTASTPVPPQTEVEDCHESDSTVSRDRESSTDSHLGNSDQIPSMVNGDCSMQDDEGLRYPEFSLHESEDEEDEHEHKCQYPDLVLKEPESEDFGDFTTSQVNAVDDEDDFGEFNSKSECLEDDFGDFATCDDASEVQPPVIPVQQPVFQTPVSSSNNGDYKTVQIIPEPVNLQLPTAPEDFADEDEEDDDFGDFASSGPKESTQIKSSVQPEPIHPLPAIPVGRRESIQLEGKLDTLVKSVFNQPTPQIFANASGDANPLLRHLETIDQQLEQPTSSPTWTHVQEFEDSHCLLHKWPRSGVHHLLLKSLNIDYSNIVYSAKYGTIQVPKFASSLVDSPLQPESVPAKPHAFDFSATTEDGMRIERLDDDSPETEEMSPVNEGQSCPPLNKEAIRILEQLPDLSYMLAKTLVFPRHPNY